MNEILTLHFIVSYMRLSWDHQANQPEWKHHLEENWDDNNKTIHEPAANTDINNEYQ